MRSPCAATKSSPRSLRLEKARAQQRRPNAAKNKERKKERKKKEKKKESLRIYAYKLFRLVTIWGCICFCGIIYLR